MCRARTASSVYSALISTLTLISLVEITWMLMDFSARARNIVLATPVWLRMPTPTTLILATLGSTSTSVWPNPPWIAASAAWARGRSVLLMVKVMSVVPSAPMFCTIMSTLTLSSASLPKIAAATPGRSGTRRRVIFASSRA